jgi:hypothetical protein
MHEGHGFSRAALVLADEGFKPRLQPLLWRILHEMLVRGAKHAEEKASLNEGHGFSRAVKGFRTTASAAEVRFSTAGKRKLVCFLQHRSSSARK